MSNAISYPPETIGSTQYDGVQIGLQESLSDNYVLLKVNFRCWGDETQADKGEMIIDSNKSLLSLSKKLIESPAYDDIKAFTKATGKAILRIALPASKTFRAGFYRAPIDSIRDLDDMLSYRANEFNALVSIFLNQYENAKERASRSKEEGGLGILYRESDYPNKSEIEQKFSMSWSYLSFGVPSSLPAAIQAREREKFRNSLQAAKQECIEALRLGFSEIVNRAADRLKSQPDGKPQKFTSSLNSQMAEFLDTFSGRNSIGNDEALAQLVEQARSIMKEVPDLTALKTDAPTREKVQAQFQAIKERIDSEQLVPKKGMAIVVSNPQAEQE